MGDGACSVDVFNEKRGVLFLPGTQNKYVRETNHCFKSLMLTYVIIYFFNESSHKGLKADLMYNTKTKNTSFLYITRKKLEVISWCFYEKILFFYDK